MILWNLALLALVAFFFASIYHKYLEVAKEYRVIKADTPFGDGTFYGLWLGVVGLVLLLNIAGVTVQIISRLGGTS